ncbi:MAG: hypothetical protein NT091_01365 [Candidatus Falkowbacteria bacterium]|nr:hypothetical protein [Candidatus Falkowbacteria bacterium]
MSGNQSSQKKHIKKKIGDPDSKDAIESMSLADLLGKSFDKAQAKNKAAYEAEQLKQREE